MNGFSLLEILIALTVITILAVMNLPSWHGPLQRADRLNAETRLFELATALENYHLSYHTYANARLENFSIPLGSTYQFELITAEANHFQLRATPLRTEKECATLGLNQAGLKTSSGNKDTPFCWS